MKKPKITIKGLQTVIKGLEAQLEILKKNERESENNEYRLRKDICEILMNGQNMYRLSEVSTWGQIKSRIARLTGQVTKEGEMSRYINNSSELEKERLWYLMRVAMKDPKLEVPKRMDILGDIFGGTITSSGSN